MAHEHLVSAHSVRPTASSKQERFVSELEGGVFSFCVERWLWLTRPKRRVSAFVTPAEQRSSGTLVQTASRDLHGCK